VPAGTSRAVTPRRSRRRIVEMSPTRWSERAATVLASFAVLALLHTVALLALGLRGAPTLWLSLATAAYAAAAGRSAQLLRRGALGALPAWLALWAVSVLTVVVMVAATFAVGPLFWWSAAGGSLTWLAAGVWLARRVAEEARAAPPASALAAAASVALPNESLPLPTVADARRRLDRVSVDGRG
jgi:hypothetical protein